MQTLNKCCIEMHCTEMQFFILWDEWWDESRFFRTLKISDFICCLII